MRNTAQYFKYIILAGLVFLLGSPSTVLASQIELDVALGTPYMQAGKKQKAFLKVSLKGFESPRETFRAPINAAVVLDKSGSMQGEKIERAKQAAIMALSSLNSNDIISVVTYSDTVNVLVPANRVNDRADLTYQIGRIRSQGRTALFAGVSKGAYEVRKYLDQNRVNRVILLSDGLANVGPSSASELGQLGASLGQDGMSVTTIGLGLGYNEDLMTRLAGYSDGNHAFAENASDLADIFRKEFNSAMSVVAKELHIIIRCNGDIRPIRVMGRDAQIVGQTVRVDLNQLSSSQEKFIVLEVEVPEGRVGQSQKLASVDVSYRNLHTKRNDALNDSVSVNFTESPKRVEESVNKKVMESAIEQVIILDSKDAVRLRDKGDISGAKKKMQSSADFLKENARRYNSPKLESLESETRQDADDIGKEMDWNKNRKSIIEKQYKRETQQVY
jgi:Ca-activated chloride channel family protein